ncbi:ribosomal RNA small subunit methyltransferase I [Vandammella animalimorsus]|uniref:Ribosomal RNA small subunit methyltransferase I n=1 Tax=Vandammella animalimorsus TaxID=2029117 RepID=A0A3M6RSK0_9BURK|nr:SAM-dependent methyltransferase [Vandammella animalimorsus]RMX18513.1 ribosomal RNA small subunit methyltransferase I [Vandammella animalimorsus]
MSAPAAPTAATAPRGRLLLVPAPLDFGCAEQVPLEHVLPAHTLREAARLRHWIAESAKSARAYLKRIDALYPLAAPLQELHIAELPRHIHKQGDHAGAARPRAGRSAAARQRPERHGAHASRRASEGSAAPFEPRTLLQAALAGHDIGLLSEAGMPGVADPGSSIVRAAHQLGLGVLPLVGPVSLLLALAASGLNGQSFAFVGYLPQDDAARAAAIGQLEAQARRSGQAQILIETPYRNARLWQALLQHLRPETWLSISAGLSLPSATSQSRPVQQWRSLGGACPVDGRTPAVFTLGC